MRLNNFHYGLLAVLLVGLIGVSNFDFSSLTGYQTALTDDPCLQAEQLRNQYVDFMNAEYQHMMNDEEEMAAESRERADELIPKISQALSACRGKAANAEEILNFLDYDEKAQQPKFVQQESIVGECPIIVVDSCGNGVLEGNEECDPPGYFISSLEQPGNYYDKAVTCTEECKLEVWNYYKFPQATQKEIQWSEQKELDLLRRGLNRLKHNPQFDEDKDLQRNSDFEELRKERQSRPATGGSIGGSQG